MGVTFNANEVFEMAKQIEINGGAFYRKAAENATEGKDLLLEIAAQEDEHLEAFTELQTELSARETEPSAFDPNDEGELYLKAMAGGKVFDIKKDPAETLKGTESLNEILKIAIGMEKDSIIFYLGIKEMVSPKLGEDKVIKEEMKHIRWLSEKTK
ncbi:rubrerythrin [Verrucomicrobiota bacterium]